jgi:flagellar biogenesis protein FliO
MTTHNFLLALGIGSALIAFWLVIRFPDRGPADMQRAVLHALAAFTIGWIAPSITAPLMGASYETALFAIFVVLLPVLVYLFVSGAWVLKLIHQRMSHMLR